MPCPTSSGIQAVTLSLQPQSRTFSRLRVKVSFACCCVVSVRLWEQKENVREDILKLGHGVNAVEIDLMEPLDPTKPPR